MEVVEPIREKKHIEAMKKILKGSNVRDYVLFVLGINSGLRISDLLNLTVEDVKGKDRITLREMKTRKRDEEGNIIASGKLKDFPLSEKSKKVIADYLKDSGLIEGALFPSKKGKNPISRIQAYRILNNAGEAVGIKTAIGTHSLRKTFGFWAYQQGVDITRIQKLLNHSTPAITLAYIGITKQELDDVYINLDL